MLKFAVRNKVRILQKFVNKLNYSKCPELSKIVELPVGKVLGKHQVGCSGHDFYSFEGIPFGKPPIGDLRFRAPQPAEPWKQLDCRQEREPPVQFDRDTGQVFGSEDCLYLNVYTKHLDTTEELLPVMVYIHGGGFRSGGAIREKYGPDHLLRENIVYVVFSYRLCALGFLSLSSPELGVPGNAGLHDQILALRWVNKYIQCFNGDPKNITIMGTSAGAASVHFMMSVPEACGLFHRAIMMSGTMLNPWVQVPNTSSFFCRLALSQGYTGEMTEESVLHFLRSLCPEALVQHHLFGAVERCFGHLYPFVPTLETPQSGGLLQQPYLQLMREAWSGQVPLLIGGTSFEGLVMYPYCIMNNGALMDLLIQHPAMLLPFEVYTCLSEEERKERSELLLRFHYGPRPIDKSNVMQTLEHFSYKLFWHGINRTVMSRLNYASAPTFMYRFDVDTPTSNLMRSKLCGNDIKHGVCHADELGFIFPRRGVSLEKTECLTIDRMVSILTTFARTGSPTSAVDEMEAWPPVNRRQPFSVMNIGHKLELQPQTEWDGIKVWNQLYNNDSTLLYGASVCHKNPEIS